MLPLIQHLFSNTFFHLHVLYSTAQGLTLYNNQVLSIKSHVSLGKMREERFPCSMAPHGKELALRTKAHVISLQKYGGKAVEKLGSF